MREALEMRDDGESRHTDGDGKANWERIGKDVFGEAIFDAVGVFL